MLHSIVGYGTFLTKGFWKNNLNVEVCLVKNFIRIFVKEFWYPFVLANHNSSFKALKFDINKNELKKLDIYEGVPSNLFERVEITVFLRANLPQKAYIYIPTRETVKKFDLKPDLDTKDRWKQELKKCKDLINRFPDLIE